MNSHTNKPFNTDKYIYMAGPCTPMGGGMYRVTQYLIQSQLPDDTQSDTFARLRELETRGAGSALKSIPVLLMAMLSVLKGRVSTRLVGVHVNVAERLSLFRKCALILWTRALGLPVVIHLHAAQLVQNYAAMPKPVQAYVRWCFGKADHCVVLGKAAEDFVVNDLKVPASRVSIVNNGVPNPQVARSPLSAREDKFQLLFLGNLSERKGVSDLLKALSQSELARRGKLKVVLAGGGDADHYRHIAGQLGIESFTAFAGWCDQRQAASLMASSDALVLPSYDEGLPLVILEALANNVAVICTPVGEIHHNLTHGVHADFVNPGDINALSQSIDKVLGDPSYRAHLQKEGRALFDKQFSLDQFSSEIAKIHRCSFSYASKSIASK